MSSRHERSHDDGAATVPNGDDNGGRDPQTGKFTVGNRHGARSKPHARSVATWRAALAAAVTQRDIAAVTRRLVAEARAGRQWAICELLNRTCGNPAESALLERLEQLEELILAERGTT